jgi:hypothetical protein
MHFSVVKKNYEYTLYDENYIKLKIKKQGVWEKVILQ